MITPRSGAALLCAAVVGCAHGGGTGLALPSNFDDRRLDAALSGGHGRAVLAILPFDAGRLASADSELRIGDLVTTALSSSGRVVLVERERIDRVLAEQKLKLAGAVDDASQAAEVGKLLGAEAVVFGAVSAATQQTQDRFAYDLVRTEVRIDARAVDTTTGRILVTQSGSGISEAKIVLSASGTLISGLRDTREEYRKAAAAAATELGRRIAVTYPVVGLVVKVGPGRVICDLGASSGVAVGQRLLAVRAGQKLLHPVTHEVLGYEKSVLGRLAVRTVDQQSAGLEPLDEFLLKPGDVVVLPPAEETR